jgi:hypothetical protein
MIADVEKGSLIVDKNGIQFVGDESVRDWSKDMPGASKEEIIAEANRILNSPVLNMS